MGDIDHLTPGELKRKYLLLAGLCREALDKELDLTKVSPSWLRAIEDELAGLNDRRAPRRDH